MKKLFVLFVGVTILTVSTCTKKVDITAENKTIARRFWEEGWKQGNQAVFDEICATDFANHDPSLPEVIGLEAYKQHVALHATAFPADVAIAIEDMVAEGNKVAVRWTWRVTHEGEYLGIPPTGNQITMTGITIHRFADGKVVENWHNYDALGFMQQLGVIPAMGREDFTWGEPMEPVTGAPGDPEENKAIYLRELEEVWKQRNVDVLDEIFTTNFVNHDPAWPRVIDLESYKQWTAEWLTSSPDMHITIDDIFAEGDMVVVRWTSRWTDTAGAAGKPPTGKRITVTGIDIIRCAGGKIEERWWSKDALGAMQQLGVIPPPEQDGE